MPEGGKKTRKGGCPYSSNVGGAARKRRAKTAEKKSKSHSRKSKSKSRSRKSHLRGGRAGSRKSKH